MFVRARYYALLRGRRCDVDKAAAGRRRGCPHRRTGRGGIAAAVVGSSGRYTIGTSERAFLRSRRSRSLSPRSAEFDVAAGGHSRRARTPIDHMPPSERSLDVVRRAGR